MTQSLANDPRWIRLNERGWTCKSCEQVHSGIFDLGCRVPDAWDGGGEEGGNSLVDAHDHFLSEDLCAVNGEHFFLRCVLQLPIPGGEGRRFGYGVWSSLSQANFRLYVDGFDRTDQSEDGPWFGWLCNSLRGYPETSGLKCQVHPQDGRSRPLIELEQTDHPLAIEQRRGIGLDRLLEIYRANGHEPDLGRESRTSTLLRLLGWRKSGQ